MTANPDPPSSSAQTVEELKARVLAAAFDNLAGKADVLYRLDVLILAAEARGRQQAQAQGAESDDHGAGSDKPRSMEFFNSKFMGEGAGKAGDCRVVVRTDRKRFVQFVQIIDDSDGVGLGFTASETRRLIDALGKALQKIGSGTDAQQEQASATRRSAAPQDASSNVPAPPAGPQEAP